MITIERLNWLLENAASSEVREMAEAMFSMRRQIAEIINGKENAIAAAVEAEREACAKIAEKRSTGLTTYEVRLTSDLAKSIAKAIRARQNP